MAQSSTLIKRLALAAVGQALPEASALSATFRAAQKGLVATVITGVLFAGLIIIGLLGFYLYLVSTGVTQLTAIGVITLILLMLTVISGLVAERYLSKVPEVKHELRPLMGSNSLDLPLQEMFTAFMDGIASGGAKHADYRAADVRPTSRSTEAHQVAGGDVNEFAGTRYSARANGASGEKRPG